MCIPGAFPPSRTLSFFLDELEALLREWVAVVYHRGPHSGIGRPVSGRSGCHRRRCSNTAFLALDTLEAPRDPAWPTDSLAVQWRTIQHYGFEIDGRYYRGPGLQQLRSAREKPFSEERWQVAGSCRPGRCAAGVLL